MWGQRPAMFPFAKLKRSWSPLVEYSTHISRAPGTKQGCKEKYKQVWMPWRVWGHPGSRECAPQLTGVRQVTVHLPAVLKKNLLFLVWRGGKHYSECLEQVATGCGSGGTGSSAAPELPSLTAPRKADLLNVGVWRSGKGAGPPHTPGLRRSAKATSCSMPQPGGCRRFVLPCFVLALD